VILFLLILHQNPLVWGESALVAGLPANLAYHVLLCVLLPVFLLPLLRKSWPNYRDDE
jgi:hypothetical protein